MKEKMILGKTALFIVFYARSIMDNTAQGFDKKPFPC